MGKKKKKKKEKEERKAEKKDNKEKKAERKKNKVIDTVYEAPAVQLVVSFDEAVYQEYRGRFANLYAPVVREMNTIKNKAKMLTRNGRQHFHTVGEVLNLPQWAKIQSIEGTIRAYVDSWISNDKFPTEAQVVYNEVFLSFGHAMDELQEEIIKREPKRLESIIQAIRSVTQPLLQLLPALAKLLRMAGITPPLLDERRPLALPSSQR